MHLWTRPSRRESTPARPPCSVLFRKMTKETMGYVKKQFEAGNDISWRDAVKGHTITQGLRYSLATGNWGVQGDAAVKPGVAQARHTARFAAFHATVAVAAVAHCVTHRCIHVTS
jgi:hypothetical protein